MGNQHNIDRTTSMLKQLEPIRLTNNIATHQYSLQHLKDTYIHPFNRILIQENGRIIRPLAKILIPSH